MSECICQSSFRTAEDYRDHLPCNKPMTQREEELLRKVERLEHEVMKLCQEINRLHDQAEYFSHCPDCRHSHL